MRAMVYRGPYKIRVEEKEMPSIEHPNDAIIRVMLASVCGSDLHLYHGMMPDTRVGTTFGHEFIGIVHAVGPLGAVPKAGRQSHGTGQYLLRLLFLLRSWVVLQPPFGVVAVLLA